MAGEKEIAEWKTKAWVSPNMAQWYGRQMELNLGSIPLKNAVEVHWCEHYAIGPKVLDVGIGSGRGSLPLARKGYQLTGVDSSQAMLDVCAEKAAPLTPELRVADLFDLPFDAASFDTALSLNVLVHFPNWQDAVQEWARVVRPGGRIIFDVHSMDHRDAVAEFRGEGIMSPLRGAEDPEGYVNHIGAEALVAMADENKLAILGVLPYAGVFGSNGINGWLLKQRADGHRFERFLSWLPVDQRLFAFMYFLETEVVAQLSTHCTNRMMVVLEKRANKLANRQWLQRNEEVFAVLTDPEHHGELQDMWFSDWDETLAKMTEHFPYPMNGNLLYFLASSFLKGRDKTFLSEVLPDGIATALRDWVGREEMDDACYDFVTRWYRDEAVRDALDYQGINLAEPLEYELTSEILSLMQK